MSVLWAGCNNTGDFKCNLMERLSQEATRGALGSNDKSLTRPVTVGVEETGQINNRKQVTWINICKQQLRLLLNCHLAIL